MADHLKNYPPEVNSSTELAVYFCKYHNQVNELLNKGKINCKMVKELWEQGMDKCDCNEEEDEENP